MKQPKFTDAAKYPHGYRRSAETDITVTFRRIKAEQKAAAEAQAQADAEAKAKVQPMRKAK